MPLPRKLTDAQVLELRMCFESRENAMRLLRDARATLKAIPTSAELARQYGCCHSAAQDAARGITYKDIRCG